MERFLKILTKNYTARIRREALHRYLGWLVLEDSKDAQHQAASNIYAETGKAAGNILTTNFVLDETFSRLFRRRPFEEASRFAKGLLESPFIGSRRLRQLVFGGPLICALLFAISRTFPLLT